MLRVCVTAGCRQRSLKPWVCLRWSGRWPARPRD